jgi:putative NADH-flavin reductase
MKITVLGSTGGTGQQLIHQALERGYHVRAVARSPENIKVVHTKLTISQGDVFDLSSLKSAFQGQDAIIFSVGISGIWKARKPVNLYSQGIKNTVKTMEEMEVKRLIAITSAGIEDVPGDPFIYRRIIKPLFLKNVYRDMLIMEDYLSKADINWTIVRPPRLTNGPLTKMYRQSKVNFSDDKELSRADLAHFILNEIEVNDYEKSVVAVSY